MMMRARQWTGATLAIALIGCGPEMDVADGDRVADAPEAETAVAREPDAATPADGITGRAVAVMRPAEGGDPIGQVLFTQENTGEVRVTTSVEGLTPGRHAHHVHEFGDCRAEDDEAAGPHFPFFDVPEGAEPDFITGNLGDIVMPGTGERASTATAETTVDLSEKGGLDAIVGRAVLIHAMPNDPSQPPGGGAGERVACGVIGMVQAD